MEEYLLLYPNNMSDECPIVDEPGISINAMIQAIIVGVILWYLLSKQ